MLIKIPSRFLQQSEIDKVKEVYINTESIVSIEVTKRVYPKWDKEKKRNVDGEFETNCNPTILMTNSNYVPLKWDMNEPEFNDLINFINEKIYLSKIQQESKQ